MLGSSAIANEYVSLQARFSTDRWTQPLGLAAHRENLRTISLEGSHYQRTFEYDRSGIGEYLVELGEIERAIAKCGDLGHVAERVAEQLQRDRLRAKAVEDRNDSEFSSIHRMLDGAPSEVLVLGAKRALATDLDKQSNMAQLTVDSVTLAARMVEAFRAYGLNDWHVEIEENMSARASVNGPLRRVRVRKNEEFSELDADRLIVHEIGGHVLRWANSQRQPEPWAKVPLGRTLQTEEGLAISGEEDFDVLDLNTLRKYQVRYLAVFTAINGGILDVLRAISPYLNRSEAVEIAIRTKRGLVDPNGPGGSTKDYAYYDGFLQMQELRLSNPSVYQILRGVKWSREDISLISDLLACECLILPTLFPDREKLGINERPR